MARSRLPVPHSAAGTTTHTTLVAQVVTISFQQFPGLLGTIVPTGGPKKLTYQIRMNGVLGAVTDWPTSGSLSITMLPHHHYALLIFDTEFELQIVHPPSPVTTSAGQMRRLQFLGHQVTRHSDEFSIALALAHFQAESLLDPTGHADHVTQARLVRAAKG